MTRQGLYRVTSYRDNKFAHVIGAMVRCSVLHMTSLNCLVTLPEWKYTIHVATAYQFSPCLSILASSKSGAMVTRSSNLWMKEQHRAIYTLRLTSAKPPCLVLFFPNQSLSSSQITLRAFASEIRVCTLN